MNAVSCMSTMHETPSPAVMRLQPIENTGRWLASTPVEPGMTEEGRMPKCSDVMTREPACCEPSESIAGVAEIMKRQDVGAVPVVDSKESRRLVGIVTDRDIVMKLADRMLLEPDQRVDEIMTRDPVCLGGNLSLERGLAAMRSHRIRRVPILNDMGELVGVISLDDILVQMGRSMGQAAGLIEDEVVGRPEDRWPRTPTVAF